MQRKFGGWKLLCKERCPVLQTTCLKVISWWLPYCTVLICQFPKIDFLYISSDFSSLILPILFDFSGSVKSRHNSSKIIFEPEQGRKLKVNEVKKAPHLIMKKCLFAAIKSYLINLPCLNRWKFSPLTHNTKYFKNKEKQH